MLHLLFLHLGEEKKKRAETKMCIYALVYHGWIFGVPKKKEKKQPTKIKIKHIKDITRRRGGRQGIYVCSFLGVKRNAEQQQWHEEHSTPCLNESRLIRK